MLLKGSKHYLTMGNDNSNNNNNNNSDNINNIFDNIKAHIPQLKRKSKTNGKTYNNCFVGTTLVDYMYLTMTLTNRNEATNLAKVITEKGLIVPLTIESFEDDYQFYQFKS